MIKKKISTNLLIFSRILALGKKIKKIKINKFLNHINKKKILKIIIKN